MVEQFQMENQQDLLVSPTATQEGITKLSETVTGMSGELKQLTYMNTVESNGKAQFQILKKMNSSLEVYRYSKKKKKLPLFHG